MLLLVTILLVLIAAVTLLIGIFSDNLALIFVSIGASALAAIVLAALSQVSKRKAREATPATGPEPLPAREPATVGGGAAARSADAEQAAADIATIGEPVGVASDAPTTTMAAVGGPLPIADYDNLRVNQILPALADLDLDQLEAVAQHEENNKNRTTVLNRIDDLMDELEAQEAGGAPAAASADVDDEAAALVESIETIGEPVVATGGAAAAGGFPIPDYDDLDEDELIELLQDLDADQLEAVADREEAGQNRDAVLDAIDDRLDILEGIVPAPPAKAAVATKTAPAKAPAKKTPVKAAASSTKKVTPPTATRKASAPTAVKKTAAAKKSTAAPAKKTAAAPAKKAATKTASKAPAKSAAKAPAKKAAASTAKATKKAATTAKKAAPVKKASAAKKTAKR